MRLIAGPRRATAPAAAVVPGATQVARDRVRDLCYEIVPVGDPDRVVAELAAVPAAPITVTCSPTKGLQATLDLTARLLDLGHRALPHIAARLVVDDAGVRSVAAWLRRHGIVNVFIVGGDAERPAGRFADGLSLLQAVLEHDTPLRAVGVPTYPEGHPVIPDAALSAAVLAKQAAISGAGLVGWTTTQMCLDASQVARWLSASRANGLTLPVHIGIPGVVDRAKLMRLGMRMGVGQSLRYLRKNRGVLSSFAVGGFDPTDLVTRLPVDGIAGLHSFTFNSVAATARWQGAFGAAPGFDD